MIRIKDIAELAGVSTATVSNVIHGNSKKVSSANIEKIQRILKETGYIPSMGARLLVAKRSNIIGVIVGGYRENGRHYITDPFLGTVLGAIEREISGSGYYMFFHQAEDAEAIRLLVSKWNVDGLITIGVTPEDNQAIFESGRTPLVSVDVYYENQEIVNIGLDDYGGGRKMADYLLGKGHKDFLFLSDNNAGVDHMRYLGVCRALEEKELKTEGRHLLLPTEREKRKDFHRQNLERYKRAGALFFASDFYAVEGLSCLVEAGIRVPEEISVAGFDDNFLAVTICPELTTVHQDIEGKGRLAVERLLFLLRGSEGGASVETKEKKEPVKASEGSAEEKGKVREAKGLDVRLPVRIVERKTVCSRLR